MVKTKHLLIICVCLVDNTRILQLRKPWKILQNSDGMDTKNFDSWTGFENSYLSQAGAVLGQAQVKLE